MKVLYIGGTGEISFHCIHASVAAGHDVYVFNRGHHNEGLPDAITHLPGDLNDEDTYRELADHDFDAICQFRLFTVDKLQRDLDLFTGRCGQYVFISSASAYQKPLPHYVVTEDVPLDNPFWTYSQNKAAMERTLQDQSALPFTIVRPSHTYRTKFPSPGLGDLVPQRMMQGRPVLVHGDGASLWTLTHSRDFAPPFVKLLGNDAALGEAFHLTSDHAYAWDRIHQTLADLLGVEAKLVHVPTDTLIRYEPKWTGPLLGDKTGSTLFDNSKIKSVVGDFDCPTTLEQGLREVLDEHRPQDNPIDGELDALWDRIIDDQEALGDPDR